MLLSLLALLVIGLIAGGLARLLVPGPDPMGFLATAALGIAGSFLGGLLGSLLFEGEIALRQSGSFLGAIIGAVIVLLLYRMFSKRR